jgi:bifunctional UDP-N-acetylglucosamine pyrophosphorylase/glucosamine-1-phosphate N-acetyltransferase
MKTVAIVLAAGKGLRMKSNLLKVFHQIGGRPMLDYVLDALKGVDLEKIMVVVGHQADLVKENFNNLPIKFVEQKQRLGTGHAVMQTAKLLKNFDGNVLVLNGDTPLITQDTIKYLLGTHVESNASATVLTAEVDDPSGYGRILRGAHGTITRIVEEKDATERERSIKEFNTGTYCFNSKDLFSALKKISPSKISHEYYLTDTVHIMKKKGLSVVACRIEDSDEAIGINTRQALAKAEKALQSRMAHQLMDQGVTIIDPTSTFIDTTVSIGQDTIIKPFTFINGKTIIEGSCEIGPMTRLRDVRVGRDAIIRNSDIEDSTIASGAQIIHSFIRKNSVAPKVKIGPFETIQ